MKLKKIRVCVIEDEENVRKALIEAINESKELEVVGEGNSVKSGVETILKNAPDLIFLDIKLIGGDAFMLLDELINIGFKVPPVVINTGHEEFVYAQRVHNEYKNIVFYILRKPFWENWEQKEAIILKNYYATMFNNEALIKNDRIVLKTRYKIYIVLIDDIQLLQVSGTGKGRGKMEIITKKKNYLINKTLANMESELPPFFVRINRFDLVNGKFISEYDFVNQTLSLFDYDEKLSVGSAYKDSLIQFLENM